MFWFADDVRSVMWVAVIPACLAVTVLVVYVREPDRPRIEGFAPVPLTLLAVRRLPARYWLVVLLGAAVTLARFSEAFLVLRAQDIGLDIRYVPVVMMVMNVAYAGAAYPAGAASDRVRPRTMLVIGLVLLIVADLVLAIAASPLVVFAGAALWGLHMGLTQGLLSKLVADAVPAHLVGTGFGIFNIVSGGALLLASLIAGSLWTAFGASATFLAGALFATAAGLGVLISVRRPSSLTR
jgi:MFS family permease